MVEDEAQTPARTIKTRIDMLSTGIKTPVGIKVGGPDLEVLERLGKEIKAKKSWLQPPGAIGNPYFSQSTARCGTIIAD